MVSIDLNNAVTRDSSLSLIITPIHMMDFPIAIMSSGLMLITSYDVCGIRSTRYSISYTFLSHIEAYSHIEKTSSTLAPEEVVHL